MQGGRRATGGRREEGGGPRKLRDARKKAPCKPALGSCHQRPRAQHAVGVRPRSPRRVAAASPVRVGVRPLPPETPSLVRCQCQTMQGVKDSYTFWDCCQCSPAPYGTCCSPRNPTGRAPWWRSPGALLSANVRRCTSGRRRASLSSNRWRRSASSCAAAEGYRGSPQRRTWTLAASPRNANLLPPAAPAPWVSPWGLPAAKRRRWSSPAAAWTRRARRVPQRGCPHRACHSAPTRRSGSA